MQKSKSQNKEEKKDTQKKVTISIDTPLSEILELGKACDRSGHCCSYGSGFVLIEEVPKLAKQMKMKDEDFIKKYLDEMTSFNTKHFKFKQDRKDGKPYGPCIFLDEKKLCKIHKFKPLHCRVGNCSIHGEELSIWFALNHFVNRDDPESIRQWAIYLKTHKTIKGGELKDLVPDKNHLDRMLKYELLR
jgi:Fe-S-cluster containining protein